ncbi:MAG: hypothetical protein WD850_01140 [Candidatus Spechtbacterales bacterium]
MVFSIAAMLGGLGGMFQAALPHAAVELIMGAGKEATTGAAKAGIQYVNERLQEDEYWRSHLEDFITREVQPRDPQLAALVREMFLAADECRGVFKAMEEDSIIRDIARQIQYRTDIGPEHAQGDSPKVIRSIVGLEQSLSYQQREDRYNEIADLLERMVVLWKAGEHPRAALSIINQNNKSQMIKRAAQEADDAAEAASEATLRGLGNIVTGLLEANALEPGAKPGRFRRRKQGPAKMSEGTRREGEALAAEIKNFFAGRTAGPEDQQNEGEQQQ